VAADLKSNLAISTAKPDSRFTVLSIGEPKTPWRMEKTWKFYEAWTKKSPQTI
jgi:hypothetical protein